MARAAVVALLPLIFYQQCSNHRLHFLACALKQPIAIIHGVVKQRYILASKTEVLLTPSAIEVNLVKGRVLNFFESFKIIKLLKILIFKKMLEFKQEIIKNVLNSLTKPCTRFTNV